METMPPSPPTVFGNQVQVNELKEQFQALKNENKEIRQRLAESEKKLVVLSQASVRLPGNNETIVRSCYWP